MRIHCASNSIIEQALKFIVTARGSMGLIADDGILTTPRKPSGMLLCNDLRKEVAQ
jgi:hypothetical protein